MLDSVRRPVWVVVLALALAPTAPAQVAGYRLGTVNLDRRALPCRYSEGELLCQPAGDIYLRIRRDTLIEVDSSWLEFSREFITSPDVWHRMQDDYAARFGAPDSVRMLTGM